MNRKSIFEKEFMKAVIFDLDDTLFLTQQYYTDEILDTSRKVIEMVGKKEMKAEDILKKVIDIHNKFQKPRLLNIQIKEAIEDLYGIKIEKNIHKYIDNKIDTFYLNIPKLHPNSLKVLNMIRQRNIPMGIYSHAQKDWTKRKIEYIKNEYLKIYSKEINPLYYCTSINKSKDKNGWKQAFEIFNFIPKYTLVIGDNMTSDIIAAYSIGVRNLILIDGGIYSNNGMLENKDGLKRITNIGEVLNL